MDLPQPQTPHPARYHSKCCRQLVNVGVVVGTDVGVAVGSTTLNPDYTFKRGDKHQQRLLYVYSVGPRCRDSNLHGYGQFSGRRAEADRKARLRNSAQYRRGTRCLSQQCNRKRQEQPAATLLPPPKARSRQLSRHFKITQSFSFSHPEASPANFAAEGPGDHVKLGLSFELPLCRAKRTAKSFSPRLNRSTGSRAR
jgi:hypothetical protein